MKRLVPLSILLAVLVGGLVSSSTSANGQSAGLVSSVLNRMERNRQSLKSLKASVSMEKYNSQLRDKDQYVGTVLYVPATGRNASVRIEWQSPRREILTVANGEYTLFRPSLGQAMRGKTGSISNKNPGGAGSFGKSLQTNFIAHFLSGERDLQNVFPGRLLWIQVNGNPVWVVEFGNGRMPGMLFDGAEIYEVKQRGGTGVNSVIELSTLLVGEPGRLDE